MTFLGSDPDWRGFRSVFLSYGQDHGQDPRNLPRYTPPPHTEILAEMHSCRHVLTGLSHSHRSPHSAVPSVPCHIAARRPADDAERAAIGYRTSIISSLLNYFYAPLNDGFQSFMPSPVAPLYLGLQA